MDFLGAGFLNSILGYSKSKAMLGAISKKYPFTNADRRRAACGSDEAMRYASHSGKPGTVAQDKRRALKAKRK
jgi:hypothetical protein